MRLYFAETAVFSLVSRRLPSLHVQYDLHDLGAIVLVRMRDSSHAHLPNPLAPPGRGFWERRRKAQNAQFYIVSAPEDRQILQRVVEAIVLVLGHWSVLQHHVDLDEPGQALADTLWDLSATLADRGRIRDVLAQLIALQRDLPPGADQTADTVDRINLGRTRFNELTKVVNAQTGHITALATRVEEFVQYQQTVARVQLVLRDSDFLVSNDETPDPASLTATAALAERTEAVLDAYHELTEL